MYLCKLFKNLFRCVLSSAKWSAFMLYVYEVLNLNLNPVTGYTKDIHVFPQSFQANARLVYQIR
jgi:hypothetical protein